MEWSATPLEERADAGRLVPGREAQIDVVYRESHRLWGAGLSLTDYRGLWEDLRATRWGREHAAFLVWEDARGRVLSSLKVYRPRLRIGGRRARGTVLGAIFTPAARRRRGHAAAMVRAVLDEARRSGDAAALLFSDIGTRWYESLGFRALPAEEQWTSLRRLRASPPSGWKLRAFGEADRPQVAAAHAAFCDRHEIAMERDEDHWRFLEQRSRRFFERLGEPELSCRCWVAHDKGAFLGYVTSVEGRGEWSVREVGARGGDPERMADVLRLGAVHAAARGLHHLYAWLPVEVAERLGDLRLHRRARQRAVPMLLGLASDAAPLDPRSAYLPFQDQF